MPNRRARPELPLPPNLLGPVLRGPPPGSSHPRVSTKRSGKARQTCGSASRFCTAPGKLGGQPRGRARRRIPRAPAAQRFCLGRRQARQNASGPVSTKLSSVPAWPSQGELSAWLDSGSTQRGVWRAPGSPERVASQPRCCSGKPPATAATTATLTSGKPRAALAPERSPRVDGQTDRQLSEKPGPND